MKPEIMKERPSFNLLHRDETRCQRYMQMPTWLFTDKRYSDLSLDAKVTYTLLLNRIQLSAYNGWTNEDEEVFIIFPRKELAQSLNICEQRVTAAFRALIKAELIYERRCGRGIPNQIYLAKVETPDSTAHEPQDKPPLDSQIRDARTANSTVAEPQNLSASKNNNSHTDHSHPDVSQSYDVQADDASEREFCRILSACHLGSFHPDIANMFENAIERLYYSKCLVIDQAVIPQCRIRSRLNDLDYLVLQRAERKLIEHRSPQIKNMISYVTKVVYNCIAEYDCDAIFDPDFKDV